jgi:hypothetical protein
MKIAPLVLALVLALAFPFVAPPAFAAQPDRVPYAVQLDCDGADALLCEGLSRLPSGMLYDAACAEGKEINLDCELIRPWLAAAKAALAAERAKREGHVCLDCQDCTDPRCCCAFAGCDCLTYFYCAGYWYVYCNNCGSGWCPCGWVELSSNPGVCSAQCVCCDPPCCPSSCQ